MLREAESRTHAARGCGWKAPADHLDSSTGAAGSDRAFGKQRCVRRDGHDHRGCLRRARSGPKKSRDWSPEKTKATAGCGSEPVVRFRETPTGLADGLGLGSVPRPVSMPLRPWCSGPPRSADGAELRHLRRYACPKAVSRVRHGMQTAGRVVAPRPQTRRT